MCGTRTLTFCLSSTFFFAEAAAIRNEKKCVNSMPAQLSEQIFSRPNRKNRKQRKKKPINISPAQLSKQAFIHIQYQVLQEKGPR